MCSIDRFIIRFAAPLRRLRSDSTGVVAIVIALAISALAGFAALAVDASVWSSTKNSAQGAADTAAASAVAAAAAGSSATQIQNEVYASSALAGFTNGQNGVTVTINNPPKSGPNMLNTGAYEIIIKQPQNHLFGGTFGAAPTVSGRAVALVAGKPACILALDTKASGSASNDVGVSGGATITATKCAVAANSSSGTAVILSGGSSLTASNLNVVGNYSVSGGATITATIKTGAPVTTDPYGCPPNFPQGTCLAAPSFSGCNQTNYSLSGGATATINPGVYCGGINVSGGSKLTMNPGVYIMDQGSFIVSGGCTVNGSGGVSIVLTNSKAPGGTWGTVNVSGGAPVTLTAPSSGPMQGVVIYMDRAAPTSGADTISGGSTVTITGSLYFPSQLVNYSGGSSSSACLQLIADNILFSGGSNFGVSCGSLTVPGFLSSVTKGVPAE
ncbi:MAG: hypothetical protein ACREDD_02685 [Methylocella sp.]